MLKIKFKKFFSLFLVVVLLLTHVGTAYAQNPESSSETSTSSEVTVDDETTSSDFNYEESKEEVEEELEEENIEKEEPENPEDYAEEASENVEEETEVSEEDTAEVTEANKELSEEDTKEETELNEEDINEETNASEEDVEEETEAEGEGSDVARSAEEETEEEEIEVEIIDGEVVEKNKEETEEEIVEEVAETVPVTYAQDPGLPAISWIGTPECEASYDITIDPNGGTVSKLTVAGVEVDLSGIDTTQIFIHTITTSRTEEIEIVAENEVGEDVKIFPQVTDHTYTYSVSSLTVSSHKINSTCSVCGLDCGEAQFDAPSGIGVEWEEGGAEPFGLPVYPSPDDWLAPLLLLVYENNEHVPAPTSPNQPTVRLETADGQVLVTQTFTILKRQSLAPPTGITTQNASSSSADDGKIIGVDSNMQWSYYEDQGYQPITGTTIENLAPRTYYVRFKETDDHIASNAATVTVGYNQPPSPGGGGSGGGGGRGGTSHGH